ncbi:MAG: hypothetical protein K0Q51_344 [Rickettsiaceae bacterium]|jgi:hypothetical protein|nr:hypothetical protein [Rickettsiaceae bacterium]
MPKNDENLFSYSDEEIKKIVEGIDEYIGIKNLNSYPLSNIASKEELEQKMIEIRDLFKQGGYPRGVDEMIYANVNNYVGFAVGPMADLIDSYKKKDYDKFEGILRKNKDINTVLTLDYILAREYDEKALKLLLKCIPSSDLTQTVISEGGIEAINFYLGLKGKESLVSKELDLSIEAIQNYHQNAIETLKKDWARCPQPSDKLKEMAKIGIDYYTSSKEKIDFLIDLRESITNMLDGASISEVLKNSNNNCYRHCSALAEAIKESGITARQFLSVIDVYDPKLSQQKLQAIEDLGLHLCKDEKSKSNLQKLMYNAWLSNDNVAAQYQNYCKQVAEQAFNEAIKSPEAKPLIKNMRQEIIGALVATIQSDKGLKKAYIKNLRGELGKGSEQQNALNKDSLAKQLSGIIESTAKEGKFTSNLQNLRKPSKNLKRFEKRESGKVGFIERVVHRVKKFLIKSYNKDKLISEVNKVKQKLGPFKETVATKSKEMVNQTFAEKVKQGRKNNLNNRSI